MQNHKMVVKYSKAEEREEESRRGTNERQLSVNLIHLSNAHNE